MMIQPERSAEDGRVSCERTHDGEGLILTVYWKGMHQSMYVSYFNAFRLFSQLALMLDIPLAKKVMKAIRVL